ncbi:diacylglycerol/lipid kinase family protein [Joostella sp. CR20]|uniref:diacylglycerol/lipid kinase family protein n=1 Tax=Joostella sp. CR20 TaxID=2804312 RepID=UPI00313E6B21
MNEKQQILLVVNPISGDIDKKTVIKKVEASVEKADRNLIVYQTTGKDDIRAIRKIISEKKLKKILIAGGDGTVKLCVEAVLGNTIPLGILPVGSANGMAVDLDIPNSLEQAIEISLQKKSHPIDVININNEISIHISDMGLNAALVKNYSNGSIRGKLGYALQTIPTLIDFKNSFHFKIIANGTIKEGNAMMIGIANARKYGSGAVINPDGKLNDGKFEIIIFKSLQLSHVIETVLNKIPLEKEFAEIISTEKATITTTQNIPFQVDGEYVSETKTLDVFTETNKVHFIY